MTESIAGAARTFAAHLGQAVGRRRPPFVLCYHGIGSVPPAGDPHGLLIAEGVFAAQVDALQAAGYRLVTAGELWARVASGGPTAANGLGAITFDDGLRETLHTALEILSARDAMGTAYLMPGLLGSEHPDLPGHHLVDAADVAPLAAAGFEIGAHSAHHTDLAAVEPSIARDELRDSRTQLGEVLGRPVAGMAYPFGRYTSQTVRDAREVGYTYACACSGAGPWRPYELPREPVFPSTDVRRLRLKAAGLWGPIHQLQRVRG